MPSDADCEYPADQHSVEDTYIVVPDKYGRWPYKFPTLPGVSRSQGVPPMNAWQWHVDIARNLPSAHRLSEIKQLCEVFLLSPHQQWTTVQLERMDMEMSVGVDLTAIAAGESTTFR